MKIFISLFISIFTIYTNIYSQDSGLLVNLSDAKKAVKNYYTNGQYEKELEKNINEALINLSQIEIPKNAAFVFDVDETALSNMSYELNYDYGYIPKYWDNWLDSAAAPAIPQVKRFYDSLVKKGILILFITGRNSKYYNQTFQNLTKAGYKKIETLVCKSNEYKGKKAIEFKTDVRKKLSEKYKIIGSIGDQWSDLEGGYTILKVKIPNYLYFIE
jgi:acid phosphatase